MVQKITFAFSANEQHIVCFSSDDDDIYDDVYCSRKSDPVKAVKSVIDQTVKSLNLDDSDELMKTLIHMTDSSVPLAKRLWSETRRVSHSKCGPLKGQLTANFLISPCTLDNASSLRVYQFSNCKFLCVKAQRHSVKDPSYQTMPQLP